MECLFFSYVFLFFSLSEARSYLHTDDTKIWHQHEDVQKNILNSEFLSLCQGFTDNSQFVLKKIKISQGKFKGNQYIFCKPLHKAKQHNECLGSQLDSKLSGVIEGFKSCIYSKITAKLSSCYRQRKNT